MLYATVYDTEYSDEIQYPYATFICVEYGGGQQHRAPRRVLNGDFDDVGGGIATCWIRRCGGREGGAAGQRRLTPGGRQSRVRRMNQTVATGRGDA